MKTVKVVPGNNEGTVGDRVACCGRVYEKSKNGRWGMVIPVADVRSMYVERQMSLYQIAAEFGVTHSRIQKICDENGVKMRSHYGRFEAQMKYMRDRANAFLEAHDKYGINTYMLSEHLSLSIEAVVKFFTEDLGKPKNKRRRVYMTASRSSKHCILSQKEYDVWNRYLESDLGSLTYTQYLRAARAFTRIVAFRCGLKESKAEGDHIDHIVSVYNGFWVMKSDGSRFRRKQPLPLSILCHPVNLRVIPANENHRKNKNSDMSVNRLKSLVETSRIKIRPKDRTTDVRRILQKLNLEIFEHG